MGAARIGDYTIDAVLVEEYSLEADITEYPVERGAAISDNIRIKPRGLRITGIVSDTPIGIVADLRTISKDTKGKSVGPAREALVTLETLFLAAGTLTITTDSKTYSNMAFGALSFPQTPEDAQTFSMTFKEIVIVDNLRTVVKVTLRSIKKGELPVRPSGYIGSDKKGRDIIASQLSPGVEPAYTRADGTSVSSQEAADAARRNDSALVKYDSAGHAIPVDNKDYQPYTPKQKPPYWGPPRQIGGPIIPSGFGF